MKKSDYEFYGGFPPHTRGSDTSMEAAGKQLPKAHSTRQKVYRFLWESGNRGATDDETAEALGEYRYTVAPRRRELVIAGLVVDSELRRLTPRNSMATVWKIAPAQREFDLEPE